MSTKRFFARAGVVTVAAGIATLFSGGLASAHVTAKVLGEPAQQGGYTKITFRVPNEEADAGTTKLEIKLPADSPITSARTKPMPGWTAQITRVTLDKPIEVHGAEVKEAVSTVSWTASGTRINPGEFQEFELSVGPLPENSDQLVIPAIQTYDNGTVVAWDQPPAEEGAEEPEHPAPVVALEPEGDGDHGTAAANTAPDTVSTDTTEAAAVSSTDDTARWLGGAGLLVGALGVGFGVGATLRARRPAPATPTTTTTPGDDS
ncbi:YcnI family protein [Actinophytocola sp.]|uniref:YcnI family copper-binding membrane protein n=1 Tax=Actinophytocola sp. TaxID=1872138 RepID=UPI002ED4F983